MDTQEKPDQASDELNPGQANYDRLTNGRDFGTSTASSATDDSNIAALRAAEKPQSTTGATNGAAAVGAAGLSAREAGLPDNSQKSLYNSADKLSPVGRIAGMVRANKGKGLLAGGGMTALIVGLAFGIGTIATYEIETIEKNLVADVSRIEKHSEKRRAQRDIQTTINRALRKLRGTKAEQAKIAAEDAAAGELTKAIDSFDITSPEVTADLAKSGIRVTTDSEGKFSGIKDATGKDITHTIGTDDVAFNQVEAALPEWDVGQIESFRTLLIDHASASFTGIPEGTAPEDVDNVIKNSVENGASESEIKAASVQEKTATATDPNAPVDPNATAKGSLAANEAGPLGDALNATNKAIADGATPAAAVEAGAEAVHLGTPLLAAAVATTVCTLKNDVDKASRSRVPKIMKLLIRHMTLLASATQEVHSGKIKAATMAKLIAIYNGDSSLKAKGTEAALPFSNSAAWARISGKSVNTNRSAFGYTPDINNSARPTANAGSKIVDQLDSITRNTGLSAACGALTSKYGFIVQGVFGLVQLASDADSLGASQVALSLGFAGVNETIKHVVLPEIIKYFTVYGINGLEESVQILNNTHAGGFLAFGDYARRVGGSPLSSDATDKVVASAARDEQTQQSQLSWANRTFAVSNPHSLTARLAINLPTTRAGMAVGFASFLTNLPKTIGSTFGSLLFSNRAAAAGFGTNSAKAYGITAYGFTDQEIDRMPIQLPTKST